MDLRLEAEIIGEEEKNEPVVAVIDSDEDSLTLHTKDSPFSLSLRVKSFNSEKELDKFIKCVEYQVRRSVEYKLWHGYITENLGHDACALTEETMNETKVEIHHHPISLYTICKALVNKKLSNDQEFCTFDVATDVIELHFKNKVGYMPLLSNLHEKYHNGYLDLPIELVHGDYMSLLKEFPIDDTEKDRIIALCQVKMKDCKNLSWSNGNYPGIVNDTGNGQIL